ncbi:MAG: lipid II:glycine glycyltransferase FemX [Anaerolineae bacterium]
MNHPRSDTANETQHHQAWDEFVAQHPAGHILQTSRWGQLKGDFDWNWDLVTLGDPGAPEAGALVLYRSLPLKVGTIAYVPRGPLVAWSDEEQTRPLLESIEQAARRRRAWALWVEPHLLDTETHRKRLLDLGFAEAERTVQPPRTILVDLTASEDDILMRMKSKTRYNIRLSRRKGVTVRQGTLEDVDLFYELMEKTGDRNEFGIHSETYYRRALEIFLPVDRAALFIAEVEGDPVASIIVFALGETAWYFYGASSSRHREKMPTYALQWEAIRWAKGRGCHTYDLWGIPDADEAQLEDEFTERSDGLWGVYRFKRGFGGEVVRYMGLWEWVLNPLYLPARQAQALFRTTV